MSIRLSENEKIIKEYDYASVGLKGVANASHTSKSLTITNKRIIHREIGAGIGNEKIRTTEMPIEAAKYVDTFYGMKSFNFLLILGVLLSLVALVALVGLPGMAKLVAFVLFAVLAAVCFIIYKFKKEYVITCNISTDTRVTPAFRCSSMSGSTISGRLTAALKRANRRMTINIRVKVDKDVAKAMADELGSIIADAQAGVCFDAGSFTVEETAAE